MPRAHRTPHFVHPFNDYEVLTGQGTIAMEIFGGLPWGYRYPRSARWRRFGRGCCDGCKNFRAARARYWRYAGGARLPSVSRSRPASTACTLPTLLHGCRGRCRARSQVRSLSLCSRSTSTASLLCRARYFEMILLMLENISSSSRLPEPCLWLL